MELFKFASTLFLGIGIASVLQGRLIEDKADFAISDAARRTCQTVDVMATGTMLVILAAGEFVAVRNIVAGTPSASDHDLIILLLFVTAGYVVAQSLVKRGLASAWQWTAANPPVAVFDADAAKRFFWALSTGAILGGAVFYAIVNRDWEALFSGLFGIIPLALNYGNLRRARSS